jgi:hypothetical protein
MTLSLIRQTAPLWHFRAVTFLLMFLLDASSCQWAGFSGSSAGRPIIWALTSSTESSVRRILYYSHIFNTLWVVRTEQRTGQTQNIAFYRQVKMLLMTSCELKFWEKMNSFVTLDTFLFVHWTFNNSGNYIYNSLWEQKTLFSSLHKNVPYGSQ